MDAPENLPEESRLSNVICSPIELTLEFKRGVVQQLLKSEKTLAAVSRELEPSPTAAPCMYRRVWAMVNAILLVLALLGGRLVNLIEKVLH